MPETALPQDLADVELLTKNDPYCTVQFDTVTHKTHACPNAGAACAWKKRFVFPTKEGVVDPELFIEVWDDNTLAKDVLIGKTSISVQEQMATAHLTAGSPRREWHDIFHVVGGRRTKRGRVLLAIMFEPKHEPDPRLEWPTDEFDATRLVLELL